MLSTPFNRVVALDGATGRELWSFDPGATDHGLIANDHAGFVHRGVASWSDGSGRRIFHASRWWLYALDDADGSRRGPDLPTPRHGVFPVTDAGRVLVAGGGTRSGVSTSSTLEIIWPRE